MNTEMNNKQNKVFNSGNVIMLLLVIYDVIAVNIPYFLALLVRFGYRFIHLERDIDKDDENRMNVLIYGVNSIIEPT